MSASNSSMKYILMAGGSASRMWPMSRNKHPKPFLKPNPMGGEQSTFEQMAHYLIDGGVNPADIFAAPAKDHVSFVREQVPSIPEENIIPDPVSRDNAAAVGLAVATVNQRFPGTVIAIIWAGDHYISKPTNFVNSLSLAQKIVEKDNLIVQINVPPASAYTHVGYVHIGDTVMNEVGSHIHSYIKHVEKPDLTTARRLFREGDWLVHTGYRVCRADTLLELYKKHAEDIYQDLMKIIEAIGTPRATEVLNTVYPNIRKESIDYAVLEHVEPEGQVVIKADLGWLDPGDFGSLYLNLAKDEAGDAISGEGESLLLDTTNSYVFAEKDMAVAVIGLDDIAVIATKDAVLVMDKTRAADVKKVVAEIKARQLDKYL